MNRPQRNHNPVNLRYARQKESTGQDKDGFAVFPNDPAGWRAAHNQIRSDRNRGLTLRQYIYKFAPPTENDTNMYLKYVVNALRVDEITPLGAINIYALAGVQASIEGYYKQED